MQVVKENLSPCEVSLEIEVETDKVVKALDQAYREFSRYISVPGFRKGKAPMAFVKPRVPEEQLRERTAEILVDPAYREAIEQEEITPFGNSRLEAVNMRVAAPEQAFSFKVLIPLPPQVVLGEYKSLEAERVRYYITDENIEERIAQARTRAAEYNKVDRPAAKGDIVVADLTITPEGAFEPGPVRSTAIEIGEPDNIAGLDDNLTGLKAGDDKAFQLAYPEDFPEPDAAGKSAGFFVIVKEIQEKKLPALDDDFAKAQGASSVDDLRTKIRARLEATIDAMAENRVETQLIDTVVAASKVDYPRLMLDAEIEGDVKELMDRLKKTEIDLDTYLEQSGKTRDELLAEFEAKAVVRLNRGLVVGKIASTEGLQVTAEDIAAEIAERASKQGTTPEIMRAFLESSKQIDRMSQSLIAKKVLGFITGSAIIKNRTIDPNELRTPEGVPAQITEAIEAAGGEEATEMAAEAKKPRPRARKAKAE